MSKKQHQPVLVHDAAEKMQNAIKSFPTFLSHEDQSGQKRKKQFTPGSARRKRGESKFAGAKATAHPAQANALDKLQQHQHQHHQHHHHHQQFQKGKHAPKCRPKRKKPPPVPERQANPNLRPKTNSVTCPGECS